MLNTLDLEHNAYTCHFYFESAKGIWKIIVKPQFVFRSAVSPAHNVEGITVKYVRRLQMLKNMMAGRWVFVMCYFRFLLVPGSRKTSFICYFSFISLLSSLCSTSLLSSVEIVMINLVTKNLPGGWAAANKCVLCTEACYNCL